MISTLAASLGTDCLVLILGRQEARGNGEGGTNERHPYNGHRRGHAHERVGRKVQRGEEVAKGGGLHRDLDAKRARDLATRCENAVREPSSQQR